MCDDSKLFFTLIAIANQFQERALNYGHLGEAEWKNDSYKKYKAAILLIAELFTCSDVKLAEQLVDDYDLSSKTQYITYGFLVTEEDEEEEEEDKD